MAIAGGRAYRQDVTRHQRSVEVHTITSAQASQQDDLNLRMRKYLISMSVRTVCFVLAVLFDGPLRWVFLAAAVILPYVAVVMANAGPRRAAGHQAYTPEQAAVDDGNRGRLGP
jgi:Flp pilus assembly protein TadB